jgi:hypothetical protein
MVYTLLASRGFGRPIPRAEHPSDIKAIVDCLAGLVHEGRPAMLRSMGGSVIRVCLEAERRGADISGTVFYCGGEPFTPGKAAVLERVGATGLVHYALSESGVISYKCGTPSMPDDMHVLPHRVAMLSRPRELLAGSRVQALFLTVPLISAPKVMLNVESGDYAVMEERDCGCLWQQLGYTTHVHTLRSYEKLSSEGVTFMGSMLYELLEETLPLRFGGGPTDYQLVEEEEDGLPRVSLLIAPRVGPLDENVVMEAFFQAVSFADWSRRMADQWRQSGTLRVLRREPYVTRVGKILPLHVLSPVARGES